MDSSMGRDQESSVKRQLDFLELRENYKEKKTKEKEKNQIQKNPFH